MNTFVYESEYGRYPKCEIIKNRYAYNNNLCLYIYSYDSEPITKITVNTAVKLPDDRIAIKNYSENEGMVAWLIKNNLIQKEPIQYITKGRVDIPVHMLTDFAKNLLGINELKEGIPSATTNYNNVRAKGSHGNNNFEGEMKMENQVTMNLKDYNAMVEELRLYKDAFNAITTPDIGSWEKDLFENNGSFFVGNTDPMRDLSKKNQKKVQEMIKKNVNQCLQDAGIDPAKIEYSFSFKVDFGHVEVKKVEEEGEGEE